MDQDDSDEQDFPLKKCQQGYDALKFMSVILYQATLCLYVAYYHTSNFSNIYLKELYFLFFIARPIVVFIYTTLTAVCNIH
jgi:hypothetical protein